MKFIKHCVFIIFLFFYLYINIRIHLGPALNDDKEVYKDAILQLNYIKNEVRHNNLAFEMQEIFPEGYIFVNVLYGLSWCELALNKNADSTTVNYALSEARYAYNKINSDEGKRIFPENLGLKYGVFYRGWKNYLLGKILLCENKKGVNASQIFLKECSEIAKAFKEADSPYLESYENACWPADNFLAIASLKIHDQIYEPQYSQLINDWLLKVEANMDDYTGAVSHSYNLVAKNTIEGARGSSISLILRILSEIEPEFAVDQYKKYYRYFKYSLLGFPAIREYPKGKSGRGDVDSGPVILGIGFSGTIVSIGTLKCLGEFESANLMSNTIETFGFPMTNDNEKAFIWGKLPIADLFICWSRISNVNPDIFKYKNKNMNSFGSYYKIHIYSFLVLIFLFSIFYWNKLMKILNLRK